MDRTEPFSISPQNLYGTLGIARVPLLLEKYPAPAALAVIVRGADTDRLELASQSPGLLSLCLSANYPDDHAMLEHGLIMYDALYAWCRSRQDQSHDWTPPAQA